MKHIVTLKTKERLSLNNMENFIKDARNSNDYVLINFGTRGNFIKIAFSRDMTYTVGYNILNMEFIFKVNLLYRQYPRTVTSKLAAFFTDWVNRLNR